MPERADGTEVRSVVDQDVHCSEPLRYVRYRPFDAFGVGDVNSNS